MVTSFVTLIEVLVHPLREGRPELAEEYRNILLHSPALTAIPLDEGIAEEAAGLRARHNLRTPDAIQLATAIRSGASWFLTNDNGQSGGGAAVARGRFIHRTPHVGTRSPDNLEVNEQLGNYPEGAGTIDRWTQTAARSAGNI